MSLRLLIRDVEGERQVDTDRLPLRVGTGSDSDLRLPGPGGGPVMLLDLLDDAPFVQPVGRDDSMAINGEPLVASRRLADGDELAFFGSRIGVRLRDDTLTLEVRLEDSAYVTRPPELADSGAAAAEELRPESDYWVGIEGGIEDGLGDDIGAMTAFAWVVVRSIFGCGRARSGTFVLPDEVASLVREGR